MSKDMLGSVVRAAVGVPQKRLDLLAKIASRFAGDNPEGDAWHTHLRRIEDDGLPDTKLPVPEKPKPDPTIIELGEVEVNYDETIAGRLAGIADPKCIGWRTDWATDEAHRAYDLMQPPVSRVCRSDLQPSRAWFALCAPSAPRGGTAGGDEGAT